ncbi:unnamed protein product [Fusarium venenatum]|uniref:Uncharacterized protein n=1 Tax=Fusarium venenatum TaxID=56646 RepID=A0A2L2T0C8_9HYPO|nr:uncharacterized protein FVRRES_11160 [Fusarium venenatum]CEI38469.1 unnamed protein product [Fusarium venenatum]
MPQSEIIPKVVEGDKVMRNRIINGTIRAELLLHCHYQQFIPKNQRILYQAWAWSISSIVSSSKANGNATPSSPLSDSGGQAKVRIEVEAVDKPVEIGHVEAIMLY